MNDYYDKTLRALKAGKMVVLRVEVRGNKSCIVNRVRLIKGNKSFYAHDCSGTLYQSCFNDQGQTSKELIENMKKFDKDNILEIVGMEVIND